MGTHNTFTMDVTVPAGSVGPLAAALREELAEKYWYPEDGIEAAADEDLVAWALYSAEGGSDDYGEGPGPEFTEALEARRDDGSVVVRSGGYGKLSFSSYDVETLYARHGAHGAVECELDDGISGRYATVLRDGGTEIYEAVTVFPRTAAQSKALMMFCRFLDEGGQHVPVYLLTALTAVAAEDGMQGNE